MNIIAQQLGKRFQRDWIFKQLDYTFEAGTVYAITGANGSGKSTLLQTLSGVVPATEGQIQYVHDNQTIAADNVYQYISITAPYLELIEEFTLQEMLDFHWKFKRLRLPIPQEELLEKIQLPKARHKIIAHFSSGMKQRLKLALAMLADTPVLFLDEPTTNMDLRGIDWYRNEVQQHLAGRLVLICSNQPYEYDFAQNQICITDYQPQAK